MVEVFFWLFSIKIVHEHWALKWAQYKLVKVEIFFAPNKKKQFCTHDLIDHLCFFFVYIATDHFYFAWFLIRNAIYDIKKNTFAYINMLVVVKSHEAVTSLVKCLVYNIFYFEKLCCTRVCIFFTLLWVWVWVFI